MTEQKQIAETIMCQITTGDAWCFAAVGARDYMALDANEVRRGGLMFRVTIKPGQTHKIVIDLTNDDLYYVNLIRIRGTEVFHEGDEECDCETLAKTVYKLCHQA